MNNENIGGFFFSLGVDSDEASFKRGIDAITGLKNAAVAAAAAITGLSFKGGFDLEALRMAEAIGLGAEKLDVWKTAASMAKVSTSALLGDMKRINEAMKEFRRTGQADENLAKNLGMVGITYSEFADMNAEERIRTVFQKAKVRYSDINDQANVIGKILGESAKNLFYALPEGKDLGAWLSRAGGLTFSNQDSKESGSKFYSEVMGTMSAVKGISGEISDAVSGMLLPAVTSLNDWISEHKEDIQTYIVGAVEKVDEVIGNIKKSIGPLTSFAKAFGKDVKDAWLVVERVLERIANGMGGIVGDNRKGRAEIELLYGKDASLGRSWAEGDGAGAWAAIKDAWFAAWEDFSRYGFKGKSVQDGIIAPGGGITHVAPDDWIIAAKDLESVAGGFRRGGTSANIIINQSFSIGEGVDMLSSSIREEAYRGTSSALSDALHNTLSMAQMMPGTR